ncbi:MAG: hypothetical protein HY553_20140 [Elusimicrobia bacterium]|nr:hypothetical protein [Elusimicrobiota bacterium]
MSSATSSEADLSRAAVGAVGLLVAFTLLLPGLLMSRHRRFQERRSPEYVRSWTLNGSYTPLGYLDGIGGSVDDHAYAARSRAAAGSFLPGDPYAPENKSSALLTTDTLCFMAVGLVHRITGDIHRTWTWTRFVFGFLWFALLYRLFRDAGKTRLLSAASGASATLFADLFFGFPYLEPQSVKHALRTLFWILGNDTGTLGPTRIISRAVTFPPFWLACVLAVRAVKGGRPALAAWAGLAVGACMYVHLDVGSVVLGAAGLVALALTVRREPAAREAWILAAVAGLVSIPWIATHFPTDPSMLERVGAFKSRAPSARSLLYLAAMALAWRRARGDASLLWCGALLGAVFACLNVQIATGYYVYPIYWQYIGNFCLAILAVLLLPANAAASPRWGYALLAAFLIAFGRATTYAALHYQFAALPRDVEEAIRWLDKNAEPGAVVATLSPTSTTLLGSLSRQRPIAAYLHPIVTDISREENARRLAAAAKLFRVDKATLLADAFDCPRVEAARAEHNKLQWEHAVNPGLEEEAAMVGAFFHGTPCPKAREFLSAEWDRPDAPRADYLWYGDLERRLSKGRAPAGIEVYRNASVALFKPKP